MYNGNLLRDLIRALEKNIVSLEKSEFICCGITIGQCYVILEIGLAGETSLIDLANQLELDKSTMSRTVNNLVNQGLIDRVIDTNNRRYVRLKLTEEGMAAYNKINDIFNVYLKNLMEYIPEEKRMQMMECVALLIDALKNTKLS